MQNLKKELYRQCLTYVDERIRTAEQAIRLAQEAAEGDTKSSAGDKYETTREMMQQEISRNQLQLQEALKLKNTLNQISTDKSSEIIQPGSVAITTHGSFYIAIPAGQIHFNGKTFFAISPVSPLGNVLIGLKTNETAAFNGNEFKVLQIV